ncbi:MAG: sugar phosphate isomerase/epimerase, partial [Tepidisphaeraceae bacterium]
IGPSKKLGWRLGAQAYTFRALPLLDTIDVVKSLNLRYLEAYPGQKLSKEDPTRFDHNSTPEQRAIVKQKLKDAGVVLMNYGVVDLPKDEAGSRKVFDFAKDMGVQTIVTEPKLDAWDTIEKLVKEYDIKVAIHNHPKDHYYWDPDQVLQAIKDRDPRIGACADTGHWQRSGIKPIDALKKLEGRIICWHFKDLDAFGKREAKDIVWGTGVGDAKGMLAEAKRQGFKGVIAIEYESTTGQELVDNVRKCIEFYDATAKELAE